MPYLKLNSNTKTEGEGKIIKELSEMISNKLGKPEKYVMIELNTDSSLILGGEEKPAAFVELRSIGLPQSSTGELSAAICEFVEEKMDINSDRIYINFSDVERSMWGWNGSTF